MNYLYDTIRPTRLYIKQCPKSGLKYFGKTVRHDIEKYPGSGTRWIRHLNKHGVKPVHLWNSEWYYDTSISRFAVLFSRLNQIVDNPAWANLKEENGIDGGWDHVHLNGLHLRTGMIHSEETRKNISEKQIGKRHSEETKQKIKENIIKNNKSRGAKISKALINKPKSSKHRENISKGLTGLVGTKRPRESGTHIWITNGVETRRVKKSDSLPDGWKGGSSFKPTSNTIWITDGSKNKRIDVVSNIPEGWKRGRTVR